MKLLEINPYIRRAMQSELKPFTTINRRIILDYELLYVEDGEFQLCYNEITYPCKKGDILLLCPNIPHSFHIGKTKLVQPHIHFDMMYDSYSEKVFISFRDYKDLTAQEQKMIRENVFSHLKDTPFLKITDCETFLKFFYEIVLSKATTSLACKANMLQLLDMIISENAPEAFYPQDTSASIESIIKAFIDANYQQNFQLDDLAHQFGYSKYYIEKLFKSAYNTSVITYKNRKRMDAAAVLLKKHSVSETSEKLGFSSIYAFSRAFRAAYGCSPSRYHN